MIGGLAIAAAPRRRIYREAIKGGEIVITFEELPRKAPTKQEPEREGPVHEAAAEPSSPLASWDVRLWAADIADALAGHALGGPIWQSTWLRVQAEAAGRVSLAGEQLPVSVDPELRRELLGENPIDQIIGWTERNGTFIPGLAGLTPYERDVVFYSLDLGDHGERRSAREINDLMERRRGRRGAPLALETVEQYLSRARAKLRALAHGEPV